MDDMLGLAWTAAQYAAGIGASVIVLKGTFF